jgi:hypothetical protein
MKIVGCGVADSGRRAGANEKGALGVYPNTTTAHDWPAMDSSHERLTCTTRLAAFHAAMCFQDFPVTRIRLPPSVSPVSIVDHTVP